MPTPTLTSITGKSLPEIVNNLEKQRKELEHLLSFLDSENIKEVPAETVSGQIGTNQIADFAVTRLKVADAAIGSAQIEELSVNSGHIQNLSVETGHIQDLAVVSAKIALLAVGTAHIQDLSVDSAKLAHASIDTIHIKDGVVGTLQIADVSITDGKIVSLSATKLTAGTIDTGTVNVSGPGGNLRITGNRVQVFDTQPIPIERVSMGDVNGDGTVYGFLMRGADGTTVLMDINGVKEAGITDGAITNPKIGEGAVKNNNIFADTITGDRLVIGSITGRELAVKAIKANSGIIDDLAIGSAQIIDLEVNKIKAGSMMVGTDNLAFNAAQGKDSEGWTFNAGTVRDTSKSYKGAISFKSAQTGNASPVYGGAKIWNTPYRIPCVEGEEFTASVYAYTDNVAGIDSTVFVELEWYDTTGTRIKTAGGDITPLLANGSWVRQSVTSTTPANATHVGMYFWVRHNGTVWFAAPQLQRGKFLTEYTPSGTYISAGGIMTGDITFTGTLSGVTGTFSGDVSTSKNAYVGNNIYLGTQTSYANKYLYLNDRSYIGVDGNNYMQIYGDNRITLTTRQGWGQGVSAPKLELIGDVNQMVFSGNLITFLSEPKFESGIDMQFQKVDNVGGIELRPDPMSTGAKTPYIDFSNETSSDSDARIILLDNDTLAFQGANVDFGNWSVTGVRYLDGQYGNVFASYDEWLRLNNSGEHTNGIYCGSSILRTDGRLEVGGSGSVFYCSGNQFTYNGKEVLTGTNGSSQALYSASTRLRRTIVHNFNKSHTPVAIPRWVSGNVSMSNVGTCYLENVTWNQFDFVVAGTGFASGNSLDFYWALVELR